MYIYRINNVSVVFYFSLIHLQRMNIVRNSNKISTLINLQNNTDVISR